MTPKTKRGAKTRKSMLDEATKLFSERGFEGTSTRDISEAVGISLPSIIHFFGSKQGLYEAVVEDIAKQLEERVCVASASALRTAAGRTTRLAKLKALDHLLSTLTRTLLSNPPEWARLLLQEQLHASNAGASINRFISVHAIEPLSQLIAGLRKLPVESTQVRLEVFMLLGGVVVFRINGISPFAILHGPEYPSEMVKDVVRLQSAHVNAIFSQDRK